MPKLGAEPLPLVVVVAVGAATALVTRLGLGPAKAIIPAAAALAAIWALASVAVARAARRTALLSIPALAAFVLSIVVLVVVLTSHRRFMPVALANAAIATVLVRAAIQFDRRPRA